MSTTATEVGAKRGKGPDVETRVRLVGYPGAVASFQDECVGRLSGCSDKSTPLLRICAMHYTNYPLYLHPTICAFLLRVHLHVFSFLFFISFPLFPRYLCESLCLHLSGCSYLSRSISTFFPVSMSHLHIFISIPSIVISICIFNLWSSNFLFLKCFPFPFDLYPDF